MNGYTPENDYVITDTMAAVENVPAQQPEPESEPTGQPAGQETAEPGAQQQETPTEPQPPVEVPEGEKVVYLTFDDGPTKHTPKLLDIPQWRP